MPLHPLARGVMVIVDVTGFAVVLLALNDEIFPVPLAPKPIEEFEFVQL